MPDPENDDDDFADTQSVASANMFGFNLPTSSTRVPTTTQSGVDLRPFLDPSSSSRPTAENMAPVQPQRQHPQTEEGRVQAEEQEPDTRRTVEQQGTPPRGSPRTETERFELTEEKTGLINVGSIDDPIYVKHNQLTTEEI
jgi:hypothetical protein